MKVEKVIFDEQDKLGITQEVPIKAEKLVDSITAFKGHTLFEINCSTGEITEAKLESVNATLNGGVRKKAIVNPNCLYISCLNKKKRQKEIFKLVN